LFDPQFHPWLSGNSDHEVTNSPLSLANVDIYRLSLIRGGSIVLRYGRGLETIDGTLSINTRANAGTSQSVFASPHRKVDSEPIGRTSSKYRHKLPEHRNVNRVAAWKA
jgi:hypothetical protein